VFTATLHNSGHGADRIKRRTSIVALRVFGREVFNDQLPSNGLAIHVTILRGQIGLLIYKFIKIYEVEKTDGLTIALSK
jgi:hypothetical protein